MINTFTFSLAFSALLIAQDLSIEVPKAPKAMVEVFKATGAGVQIYECRKGTWVSIAPQADLIEEHGDKQTIVGKVEEGPTFTASDGSSVTGKVQVSLSRANAMPWQLIRAVSTHGHGVMRSVQWIQQVLTLAGLPPRRPCDEQTQGAQSRSGFSALYRFYAPANQASTQIPTVSSLLENSGEE